MTEPEGGLVGGAEPGAKETAPAGRRVPWTRMAPIVIFAALAAIFLIQILRGGSSSDIPSVLIGSPAPATDLPPLEGLAEGGAPVPGITNAAFTGNITVVNIWASWCAPCRAEHPYVEALGEDPRLRVVGINQKDDPDNALAFLAEFGNPYDAVGADRSGRTSIDWGVYGVPETFLVDRTGVIRFKLIGPMNEARYRNEMMPEVEALLAEQPPPAPR